MRTLDTVLPPPATPSEIVSASAVNAGKEHRRSAGRLAKSGVYVLGAFMVLALAAGQANGAQDAQAIQVAQAGRLDSATQKKLNDALLEAARKGNTAEVRRLLDGGADANAKKENGMTALMAAVRSNKIDTVRLLIEKGADVNAYGALNGGTTPLFEALGGDDAIPLLLVEKGADVNAKALNGYTVLMSAAYFGTTDFVRLLIEKGADINAKAEGSTALMQAAQKGKNDTVRLLIEKGADINAKTKEGETALDLANRLGYPETARMLRQKGARGRSLDELVLHSPYFCIDNLVKSGANINAKNSDGETALMVAVRDGNGDKVSELLKHGASVNAKATGGSYKGWTARDIAEYNGKSDIAQLLASKGGKTTGAVQAKRQREEAESRRRQAEYERERREACSRVYVGKTFKQYYGTHRFGGQELNIIYEVRGFSPVTGEVTGACIDIENGGWGMDTCRDAARQGLGTVTTTCSAVAN